MCGLDEVGRGALAGPLVAAAVVLKAGFAHPLLRDSKRLTVSQRSKLDPVIREAAEQLMVIEVGCQEIDQLGIGWANRHAFEQLLGAMVADRYLVDGNLRLSTTRTYRSVIGGDDLVPAISAASIVAKVHRDRLMEELDRECPGYSWAANKGYGSAAHMRAIAERGPSPHHRLTFLHPQALLPF